MCCVFIGLATAGAYIVDTCLVSGEVSVAAVKVEDVSCGPVLEGFGELVHHFVHVIPVNLIKSPLWGFVLLFKQCLGLLILPQYLYTASVTADWTLTEFTEITISSFGKAASVKELLAMALLRCFLASLSHLMLSCSGRVSRSKGVLSSA